MLLLIDIGNSNIVFGIHDNKEWIKHWRIQTLRDKTADEYEVIFRSLLKTIHIDNICIEGVAISSVVPSLTQPIKEMAFNMTNIEPLIVNSSIYNKLPLSIVNTYEIGTDLVCNAISAYKEMGSPCLVIDFGTALTFTTISGNEIVGVAIAPGIRTASKALASNAAQLNNVPLVPPPSVMGKNTIHAIQSGIVYGYTGLVDSMIDRIKDELNQDINVVATGGLSTIIAPLSKHIKGTADIMFTLNGLRHIYNYCKE